MVANQRPDHREVHRTERDTPFRQCALTRSERPTGELIRFVAGPGDAIYPDLSRKLPGRGVWITADRASIAAAIKSRAFARSLKRKVEVPEDLPELVERQLTQRAIEALALANKAGLVICGFDKINTLLERDRVAALSHGADAARDGCDKLDRKYRAIAAEHGYKPVIINILTIDEMGLAMGRSNVVHAALIPGGAAKNFIGRAEKLARYRSGVGLTQPADAASGEAKAGSPW